MKTSLTLSFYLKRNEYLFFMEKQWTDIWKQLQV